MMDLGDTEVEKVAITPPMIAEKVAKTTKY